METVRTRIAPSPTGPQMHIGNFRTALYSYFWAKKNKGEFILRVEDTDRKRYVKGSVEGYLDLFNSFGIKVDRHPTQQEILDMDDVIFPKSNWLFDEEYLNNIKDEEFESVYIQTKRLPLYLKYAAKLVNLGFAYVCFLTEEELEQAKSAMPQHQPFRSPHRFMKPNEVKSLVESGKEFVIRLNVEKFIEFKGTNIVDYDDLVLGKMKFDLTTVDDQVLIKSNGIPTYHLAVVIDDYNMQITHPIRGYGWLPSTPKQIMIYEMLGWKMRPFAHVTDILDPAGGKLSKRKGAVHASEFIKQGYLPEAIINFISLVGWTPKIERNFGEKEREVFSMQEIIDLFDISGISNVNPIFDRTKLAWFNKEYFKLKTSEELAKLFIDWCEKYSEDKSMLEKYKSDSTLSKKIELVKERAITLSEIANQIQFFYQAPSNIDWNIDQVAAFKDKLEILKQEVYHVMNSLDEDPSKWIQTEWVDKMRSIAQKYALKNGDPFMVLRMCVVGSPFSPSLFEAMQLINKDDLLNRISK